PRDSSRLVLRRVMPDRKHACLIVGPCNPAGIAVRFRLDIGRFAPVNVIGQARAHLRERLAAPMWQKLSLRARINLLLALLLALGLAVNI
uniref:hypothetical protein n=1 Tax=Klebsiella michiganensis TaxID=1134687 RepID=UPI001953DED9